MKGWDTLTAEGMAGINVGGEYFNGKALILPAGINSKVNNYRYVHGISTPSCLMFCIVNNLDATRNLGISCEDR